MHCFMPIKDDKFAVGYFTPARNAVPESKTTKAQPRKEAAFLTIGVAETAEAASRFVNYLNGGTGALPQDDSGTNPAKIEPREGPASGFNEPEAGE